MGQEVNTRIFLPILRSALLVSTLGFPLAATATGRELAPIGEALILLAVGGVLGVQLLTLIIDALLPTRWPRPVRWLLAIVLSPLIAAALWFALAQRV